MLVKVLLFVFLNLSEDVLLEGVCYIVGIRKVEVPFEFDVFKDGEISFLLLPCVVVVDVEKRNCFCFFYLHDAVLSNKANSLVACNQDKIVSFQKLYKANDTKSFLDLFFKAFFCVKK